MYNNRTVEPRHNKPINNSGAVIHLYDEYIRLLYSYKAIRSLRRQKGLFEKSLTRANPRKRKKHKKRRSTLEKIYVFYKRALAFIFLDEEWDGYEIAINIFGDNLEIYYGLGGPFEKNHGHCWIRRTNGYIIYHRPPNEPHGCHNFFNNQIIAPNYYYCDRQK